MSNKRNTYVEVNVNNLKDNISKIIKIYNKYKYYFGVVKADNYGHCGIESVKAVIAGGCNYLAVATLDEALVIRDKIKDIPILCLGYIDSSYIKTCIDNNITITITSLDCVKELEKINCTNLKAHLKINTGMNRLGISSYEELDEALSILNKLPIEIEGIYTHIYNSNNKETSLKQFSIFKSMLDRTNREFKIIHMSASDAFVNYEKQDYVNGCRIGIIMYGFTSNKALNLKDTFKACSEVIQINTLKKRDTVGYNGLYEAVEDNEKIAVIPIGYADGIIRKNTGRNVYINNKPYKIVGNICMDMLFVKIDDSVNIHDKVYILKDIDHINEVANYLETIPYEVMCSIGKRVDRKYI